MADKRQVKKSIHQLQRVKTWQLFILLLLLGFVAATFLRLNNIEMKQRREAVLAADKSGDKAAATQRLYDLQRHVVAHMNTDTGVFYLEQQYKRDVQKAISAAKKYHNPNGNVNVKADAICKPQYTVWSQAYVQCFADELAKYPPSPDPAQNVILPSADLYRYSYISPRWSPDFAGWAVAGCVVIILAIAARLAGLGVLRLLLKRHYRNV